jgi:hypothetical protein
LLQRLELLGASGERLLDLQYQLEDFAALRSLVASRGSHQADPLAAVESHLKQGRDDKAVEILRELLQDKPARIDLQLKLLEMLAHRRDAKAFEAAASSLRRLTFGSGSHWEQAAALGRSIDPQNPWYAARKFRLGHQREWAYFAAFVGLYVAGWQSIPYPALLPFFIALPWLVLWLCWQFPGIFRLEQPQLISAEMTLILVPGVGLLLPAHHLVHSYIWYFDAKQVVLPAILVAIAMMACFTWIEPAFRSRRGLVSVLAFGALAVPYSAGALLNVNVRLDSEPEIYRVSVEEKREVPGRRGAVSYQVTTSRWGQTDITRFRVYESFYRATPKDGVLCVRRYAGVIGIGWYTLDQCSA